MRTSDPDIYAAGDMVEIVNKIHGKKVRLPLAGPANRQGRIAATNALGTQMFYRGAVGSSVVKVFNATAASTGLTEKNAQEAGFDTGIAYVFKDDHAAYYPGSTMVALKIVYDRKTSKLLGGQAYGKSGIEKRIDVLATALQGKMTLEDLSELDLSYAPPYNSANDPVNIAAFIGLNDISGYSPVVSPAQLMEELQQNGGKILDVRTVGEQAKYSLDGTIHIPADEVRDRLKEIPKGIPLYILSTDGFLGHTTQRILLAHGWTQVLNIAGGFSAARWFDGWKFNNELS
jgi:rhodanese-related sulfurtransferase